MVEDVIITDERKQIILDQINREYQMKHEIFHPVDLFGTREITLDNKQVKISNFLILNIFLDVICNANCPFCINKARKDLLGDPLPYDEFIKRFDNIYDQIYNQSYLKPFIMFTGGEPTISPHFLKTINHLLEKNIRFDTLTNGSNLLTTIKGKTILEHMKSNCGGMHISRAHYDDDKNQQLMDMKVKFTFADLTKIIDYIHNNFDNPYNITTSCVMMQQGINSVSEIKNYINKLKHLNLHSIVFRQMADITEVTKEKNNMIVKYSDLETELRNDKDFEFNCCRDAGSGHSNIIYHYKDLPNTEILFVVPPHFNAESDELYELTLHPNGKLYFNINNNMLHSL